MIQASFSILAYVFAGIVGLVLFLSEPPPQLFPLFYMGCGLLTVITLKTTNLFGYVPRFSRWVDRWFEVAVLAFLVFAIGLLAINGQFLVPMLALVSVP